MPQWLQHFHMKITPASPSHYMVCTPSWLHGFSPRQCFVPDPLLWTVKGSLCYREQVLINVVLLPTAFKRKNYIWESPSKLPSIHPEKIFLQGHSMKLFLLLSSGNFTLGKWELGQLPGTTLTLSVPPEAAEHITPLTSDPTMLQYWK